MSVLILPHARSVIRQVLLAAPEKTKPIQSMFAAIRLRTAKTRNCYSVDSAMALIHQLTTSAQKCWRELRRFWQVAEIIAGVKFIDRIDERKISRKAAD